MGSLTWLFPMSATHIHSGLPPFPTTTKQKSVLCNLQVRSHKTAFSFSDLACILFLRHVVFGWGGTQGCWHELAWSWVDFESYFISQHSYWSLHSFGATLPAGPALLQFILLLLSIWQEEEGGSSLLQEPQLLWEIRCMLLVSLCCHHLQTASKLEVSNLVHFKPRKTRQNWK